MQVQTSRALAAIAATAVAAPVLGAVTGLISDARSDDGLTPLEQGDAVVSAMFAGGVVGFLAVLSAPMQLRNPQQALLGAIGLTLGTLGAGGFQLGRGLTN